MDEGLKIGGYEDWLNPISRLTPNLGEPVYEEEKAKAQSIQIVGGFRTCHAAL